MMGTYYSFADHTKLENQARLHYNHSLCLLRHDSICAPEWFWLLCQDDRNRIVGTAPLQRSFMRYSVATSSRPGHHLKFFGISVGSRSNVWFLTTGESL